MDERSSIGGEWVEITEALYVLPVLEGYLINEKPLDVDSVYIRREEVSPLFLYLLSQH